MVEDSYNQSGELENEEEVSEYNQEQAFKKPNTAIGILGR